MGWRFLALLRGINVGGNNLIAKDQLRDTFEALGFCNVRTYIQSPQLAPRKSAIAASVVTAPPANDIRLIVRVEKSKKPTEVPSGEKNGPRPSVP